MSPGTVGTPPPALWEGTPTPMAGSLPGGTWKGEEPPEVTLPETPVGDVVGCHDRKSRPPTPRSMGNGV